MVRKYAMRITGTSKSGFGLSMLLCLVGCEPVEEPPTEVVRPGGAIGPTGQAPVETTGPADEPGSTGHGDESGADESGTSRGGPEPTCEDATLNGDETDMDCGGSCVPCPRGKGCETDEDCATHVCSAEGLCQPPRCDDNVLNGHESDVDCGGPCSPCPVGDACSDGHDCESRVCADDVCVPQTCGDGVIQFEYGETCDDMGASPTCDADCSLAECGDGVINPEAGETCDEAEESANCDADCTIPECGDGVVNEAAGEECDDGDDPDPTCSDDCQLLTCEGGAELLSVAPSGKAVVCDDPANSTCEQDAEQLCPMNWHLCGYEEFLVRNNAWDFPLGPEDPVVVGEIYCRESWGAGHLAIGSYSGADSLSDDILLNCGYGSSRGACETNFGCNELEVRALCCAPLPTCGNGIVDPLEACDDGNADETDDCLNSCSWRVPGEHDHLGC